LVSIVLRSLALLLGGLAIIFIEHRKHTVSVESVDDITIKLAFWVGVFQVLAIHFPGVSRSGATIMSGQALGFSRKAAAEFSFYLAIPAMFGASLIKLYGLRDILSTSDVPLFAVGFIVAFISALLVIRMLLALRC
jgi:undecaprenyl-diphosphatase